MGLTQFNVFQGHVSPPKTRKIEFFKDFLIRKFLICLEFLYLQRQVFDFYVHNKTNVAVSHEIGKGNGSHSRRTKDAQIQIHTISRNDAQIQFTNELAKFDVTTNTVQTNLTNKSRENRPWTSPVNWVRIREYGPHPVQCFSRPRVSTQNA